MENRSKYVVEGVLNDENELSIPKEIIDDLGSLWDNDLEMERKASKMAFCSMCRARKDNGNKCNEKQIEDCATLEVFEQLVERHKEWL